MRRSVDEKKKRRSKNRRREEPKIEKNKPQKTRKHTTPNQGVERRK